MQGQVVELLRELMKTQQMSVRKISAEIAREYGGSALGYTQQINRVLNDPDYDPTFSTIQKIFAALKVSLWQSQTTATDEVLQRLEGRVEQIGTDVLRIQQSLHQLQGSIATLATALASPSASPPTAAELGLPLSSDPDPDARIGLIDQQRP